MACTSTCQRACQDNCEEVYQSCLIYCERHCQDSCELRCQSQCESCESRCESSCQYCEGDRCERSCQGSCEDCQGSCEDCQTTCERSCQTGAQKNRTPGTPSSISVPSTVKGGDAITISWGTASDDNLSGYILERSINNGSYSQVYKGSNRSYKDTAQKSWNSVRYRVKGYDAYTSGAFKTSNIISVTHNTSPTISGADEDLGIKNGGFEKTFRVNDADGEQKLTVKVTLNGQVLNEYLNASRDTDYTVSITNEQLAKLTINQKNTINITCSDGTVTVARNWYFTRTNRPPEITVTNSNMGTQNKEFKISFSAKDPDGDAMTAKIYIDGVQVEDLGAITAGQEKAYSIKREDFITLKNGEHKIRIDVTDAEGSQSSSFITFTKMVTWYLYEYTEELGNMAIDIRVDMLANLAEGIERKIEVCNNALDTKPTWETIEEGKWVKFKNTTKTSAKWGLGVRVRVDRGTATQDSYIYGFNISYA